MVFAETNLRYAIRGSGIGFNRYVSVITLFILDFDASGFYSFMALSSVGSRLLYVCC